MAFFDRVRAQKADEPVLKDSDTHHADGKFKKGPANQQRALGDAAFDAAHTHLDQAKASAKGGDQAAADFNLQMTSHYGQAGVSNHAMAGYVDQTKATGVPPAISQQQMQPQAQKAKKAEENIVALQKSWDEAQKA